MLTIQGINKPVFYAYQFLNQLGKTELVNRDSASWACKDTSGNIQLLAWDFTNTLPDSVNNQQYYIRDLPSKSKGKLKITIHNAPGGRYALEIYKVGYHCNDPYSAYVALGRPSQLDRKEVMQIKAQNNGAPLSREFITINRGAVFSKKLDLRENDVYLVKLVRL